mmetsp:Transcript_24336/g.80900  ORF Transcript_24336/g.80900 Transcript_24336/m.80900 type:complete len:207 (-) Transcript_24336:1336-1956(-)
MALRPCSTATLSSSDLCSAVTVMPSAPSLPAIWTTDSDSFSRPASISSPVPAPEAVLRCRSRATMALSGPSRREANTRSTILDDALTGAPASSLALFAALSAAPFRKSSCARTAAIAFVDCEATFATFAFLSRSAAASRSLRRSASALSPGGAPASAATIMAVTPSPAMSILEVPKVAKSGGASQSPARRRPGGPQLARISLLTHL